ncbi:hypothetical protein Cflav_PD3144 [Pedosphaera parvula Ellin514]|uniref:Uncharacterized protein n=1 Tax=Pedosphaera parvula (strain Ellin514) TaxID=320771 RepID=B9XJ47_PEDPL|nr:hypothetical protein Cflav_PD3144 [Pedosphaera parvula Ellin514]
MFNILHANILKNSNFIRACFKIMEGAVFGQKAGWQGATKENIPGGSSTEEQRSQTAFCAKTLRAAVLLAAACVLGPHSPLRGCLVPVRKHLAALAAAKIPNRSTLHNFKTGSKLRGLET